LDKFLPGNLGTNSTLKHTMYLIQQTLKIIFGENFFLESMTSVFKSDSVKPPCKKSLQEGNFLFAFSGICKNETLSYNDNVFAILHQQKQMFASRIHMYMTKTEVA
jgi:hypothetical protein